MEIQAEAVIKELQVTIANQALEIASLKVALENTVKSAEQALTPQPITTAIPPKPVENGAIGLKPKGAKE